MKTILFIGDSVTDCQRNRQNKESLGNGYVQIIDALLNKTHDPKRVKLYNRGIAGEVMFDINKRLKADCIDLQPDIITILVGINETWRYYKGMEKTTPEAFETTYRHVLTQIKEQTNATLVLCEPFVLPVNSDQARWHEDLDPKIAIIKKLALEFDATYISYMDSFNEALKTCTAEALADDGVHPTLKGHDLMARQWIESVNLK